VRFFSNKKGGTRETDGQLKVHVWDQELVANEKVFVLILMFVCASKDELYYLLVRLNKRVGLGLLQKHFDFIDAFLPLPHLERAGLQLRTLSSIGQHESGIN
jgi:hypothetical protein